MKAYFFLLLLALLLFACQAETESEATLTATDAKSSPAEDPVIITATAPAPVSPTAPPPTLTKEAPIEAELPEEQELEQSEPTITPTATPQPAGRPATTLQLIQVFNGLSEPIDLTNAGDDRLFIVEKGGIIRTAEDGQLKEEPFLDIRDRVLSSGYEQGLLSIAFHPNYAENGYLYVNYTDQTGAIIVARFVGEAVTVNQADPQSEKILLEFPQPYVNHNGGQLRFGPDGYLYISLGDGGSAGDPQLNGQDKSTYLGNLLRIDVDGGDPYAIPEDNPYYAFSSARNEIWASGLRNPWRFSFDRLTGDLFIADVGQGTWEEINFQSAGSPGGENYGWNIMEGNHCFAESECDQSGLILPVGEYTHEDGHCSVTGGYVYRGDETPEMKGNYLFGDYCSGAFWRLFLSPDGSWSQAKIAESDLQISSFGEDAAGELYVLDLIGGGVYKVVLS